MQVDHNMLGEARRHAYKIHDGHEWQQLKEYVIALSCTFQSSEEMNNDGIQLISFNLHVLQITQ